MSQFPDESAPQLITDAAASSGFGAIFGSHWFYRRWPSQFDHTITFLELYPIVLAIEVWGPLMANQAILFMSDNSAVADIVNKQSCIGMGWQQILLPHLFQPLATYINYTSLRIRQIHLWSKNY